MNLMTLPPLPFIFIVFASHSTDAADIVPDFSLSDLRRKLLTGARAL